MDFRYVINNASRKLESDYFHFVDNSFLMYYSNNINKVKGKEIILGWVSSVLIANSHVF